MRAAVLYELNRPLRIEKVNLDEPQEQEVLVRLVATGVCQTDLHAIQHPWVPLPTVLGHEGAGIVEKVGPGVTSVQPGDSIVLTTLTACGKCPNCVIGKPFHCTVNRVPGALLGGGMRLHKDNGKLYHFLGQSSFAEYAVVHERTIVKIRRDAPLEVACLFGCGASTGIGAVINTAGIRPGETIAIFGCGGVGLAAVMGAKLAGAGRIIGVSRSEHKLQKAKELGADYVINASVEHPPKRILELTGGVDYAIECAGNTNLVSQAFDSIKLFGGRCIIAGDCPPDSQITLPTRLIMVGKTVTGCKVGDMRPAADIPRWIDLYMEGKLPVDKLITGEYSLDNINQSFEALEGGTSIRNVIRL